jgi:hypothetical protein
MSQERDARRRKLLASYHIISKKIFPDDTARLAWLEEQVGARSSRQLNNRELFWCICVLDGKPPPFKIKKRSRGLYRCGAKWTINARPGAQNWRARAGSRLE